eukprot:360331-Chlamydomonas_euryale.AAC.7
MAGGCCVKAWACPGCCNHGWRDAATGSLPTPHIHTCTSHPRTTAGRLLPGCGASAALDAGSTREASRRRCGGHARHAIRACVVHAEAEPRQRRAGADARTGNTLRARARRKPPAHTGGDGKHRAVPAADGPGGGGTASAPAGESRTHVISRRHAI